MPDKIFSYSGSELPVFADARNWRQYWQSQVVSFVRGHVLEVGAGIGSTTFSLYTRDVLRWVALEPDGKLLADLQRGIPDDAVSQYEFRKGTLDDIDPSEQFDTILYIDVLEHIMDDRAELLHASSHLDKNGHLIILAPAHQFLYSKFDNAIGHYRRYTKKAILDITPKCFNIIKCGYYDSIGMTLSIANKFILYASNPTRAQIQFWDTCIIPISKVIDRLFNFRIGKSLIAIFKKQK
jgi:SAM-dependent methyltransferase